MSVVVVGGGLGGALTARALQLRGVEVTVVEASPAPGGIACPIRTEGYLLEPAAGTVIAPHPHLGPLLEGLGLGLEPARQGRKLVRHDGTNVEVASGLAMLGTPLISGQGKLRAMLEPMVPDRDGDETLSVFFRRRLGPEAGRMAAWLAASGVHAGDPQQLSVESAFPALAGLVRDHGSLVRGMIKRRRSPVVPSRPSAHVITEGIASISTGVTATLGENWRTMEVEALTLDGGRWSLHGTETLVADHVVLAIAPEMAADLAGLPLGGLESAPVAVVWLGTSTPLPEAMGMLIGPDEGFHVLGFLFESAYAPFRAPPGKGLVKAIVGGSTRPTSVDLDDDTLVARVVEELGEALGTEPEVEMAHVVRHRPGIPQYTARRRRILADLVRELPPSVTLAGWGVDGVGVTQLATAAVCQADRIAWEDRRNRARDRH